MDHSGCNDQGASSAGASNPQAPRKRHHRRAKKKKAPRNPEAVGANTLNHHQQPKPNMDRVLPNPAAVASHKSLSLSKPSSAGNSRLPQKLPRPNHHHQQKQSRQKQPYLQKHLYTNPQQPLNSIAKKKRRCRKRKSADGAPKGAPRGAKCQGLVLRPTMCPPAPKNSSQYIMEGHVEDESDSSPEGAEGEDANDIDDDKIWDEFSERDFQNVYESAHREEVANWGRDKLITEISQMEKRHKELVGLIHKLDPDVYLRRLHSRASSVMEKNRLLKMQHQMSLSAATTAASSAEGAMSPDATLVTSTAAAEGEDEEMGGTGEDIVHPAPSGSNPGGFSPSVQV